MLSSTTSDIIAVVILVAAIILLCLASYIFYQSHQSRHRTTRHTFGHPDTVPNEVAAAGRPSIAITSSSSVVAAPFGPRSARVANIIRSGSSSTEPIHRRSSPMERPGNPVPPEDCTSSESDDMQREDRRLTDQELMYLLRRAIPGNEVSTPHDARVVPIHQYYSPSYPPPAEQTLKTVARLQDARNRQRGLDITRRHLDQPRTGIPELPRAMEDPLQTRLGHISIHPLALPLTTREDRGEHQGEEGRSYGGVIGGVRDTVGSYALVVESGSTAGRRLSTDESDHDTPALRTETISDPSAATLQPTERSRYAVQMEEVEEDSNGPLVRLGGTDHDAETYVEQRDRPVTRREEGPDYGAQAWVEYREDQERLDGRIRPTRLHRFQDLQIGPRTSTTSTAADDSAEMSADWPADDQVQAPLSIGHPDQRAAPTGSTSIDASVHVQPPRTHSHSPVARSINDHTDGLPHERDKEALPEDVSGSIPSDD